MSTRSKKSLTSVVEYLPLLPPSEKEAKLREERMKEIRTLKDDIRDRADKAIHQKIPEKIFSSIQLCNKFKESKLTNNFAEGSSEPLKRRKVEEEKKSNNNNDETQKFPINSPIAEMLNILKVELIELGEIMNVAKVWIQLNIPKIEDGNNFGVSIQEEAIRELQRVEDIAPVGVEEITKYFMTRAKLVSKVIKYPQLEDYARCVEAWDEKEHFTACQLACELRDNYLLVHDMILKNLEKIKIPRSTILPEERYL